MPFWEVAIHDAEARFPKILGLIEEMAKRVPSDEEEDDKWEKKAEMMKDQIKEGINAGYKEIKKLYQTRRL